ncbi:hypothetical protein Tco_0437027, partial [Tanacetum coccineum]
GDVGLGYSDGGGSYDDDGGGSYDDGGGCTGGRDVGVG